MLPMTVSIGPYPRWGVIGLLSVATWRIFSGLSVAGAISEALIGGRAPETAWAITVATVTCARLARAAPRAAQPRSDVRRRVPHCPSCRASARGQQGARGGALPPGFPPHQR